jgi:nicotinate-nucleotide--dimethylbenzimidazole phosphoribosyltransferase
MKKVKKMIHNYNIKPADKANGKRIRAHLDTLTKPMGSLGVVEEIAVQLGEITGSDFPVITQPAIIVFAADHGIAAMGVSAYPQEVTAQMVHNFLDGGAAISVLAKQIGARLEIVDIGVAVELQREGLHSKKVRYGTANFLSEEAMTKAEAVQAIEVGRQAAFQVIEDGANCLILGEMGIGNTTSSSALLAVLSNMDVSLLTGAGTGISPEKIKYKQEVIRQAVHIRNPDPKDPIDILAKLGGLEIAGMTGAILAAAEKKIPILIDGFICTVSALLAVEICNHVEDYLLIGHQSQEAGHQHAIHMLGKKPILNLGLRLGEGTGAALAYPIVEAAARILKEMATFSSAGVSEEATL